MAKGGSFSSRRVCYAALTDTVFATAMADRLNADESFTTRFAALDTGVPTRRASRDKPGRSRGAECRSRGNGAPAGGNEFQVGHCDLDTPDAGVAKFSASTLTKDDAIGNRVGLTGEKTIGCRFKPC